MSGGRLGPIRVGVDRRGFTPNRNLMSKYIVERALASARKSGYSTQVKRPETPGAFVPFTPVSKVKSGPDYGETPVPNPLPKNLFVSEDSPASSKYPILRLLYFKPNYNSDLFL